MKELLTIELVEYSVLTACLNFLRLLGHAGSANFQLNAGATNQNNPNIDPQKSTNYELGSKWELANRRLQLSGAVFRTENTNVIFVSTRPRFRQCSTSTANTTAIPSFGVADLFAEVPIGQRLLIQLNVFNVTDHVYIRGINNNAGRYTPGTPRSVLLTANLRF